MKYSKILKNVINEFEHCYIWNDIRLFESYINDLYIMVEDDYKELYFEITNILIDELKKGGY